MLAVSPTSPSPRAVWSGFNHATATPPNARIDLAPAAEDFFKRFHRWVREWRAETLYSSLVVEKINHRAFQQIVNMKELAIDLILKEIETQPDLLYLALQIITGQDPVPQSDKGNVRAATDAWIEWGRRNRPD